MTTERIDIVVREDGSREVRRNLEEIGNSANRGATGVDRLQGAMSQLKVLLASMGIAAGITEIIKYIDTWANLQGRLAIVTQSYEQMKQVQTELFAVAQRTRSAYEGTADLFARISRNTQNLNTTDRERVKVVENINKAIIISGSSAESANAALIQLGQGFASGTLRGDELNSVLEQTPRLAQAIAEGMGKTQGQLREMGKEGLLTSEAVFKALQNSGAALDSEFSKMPQTIGQSFTVLKNEILKFVGSTGEANGVAGNFATVLGFVAKNLDVIAAAMQGLLVYKLADWFLNSAAAAVRKYLALVDASNALIAERAASVAAAEAALAHAGAELAVATATQAAIVMSREEQVVRLAQANANISAARSAMAAAEAAGAQSFALYTLRNATAQLAVAEGERSAALGALAVLGQQQSRVSAQIAAATAAETAATTALAGARTAAVGAAGLAGRALGLLGGPIGIITTVLTLGATAWALWGNKASEGSKEAVGAVENSHEQIMSKLDEEIKKLKERNELLKLKPDLAKPDGNAKAAAAQEDQARLLKLIADTGKRTDLSLEARTEILRAYGSQYAEATAKLASFNQEQQTQDKIVSGDKVTAWLAKHQEYASKTEQLAQAIKEAKKDLGDAFTPEIEKRITAALTKKDGQHDALLQYKATLEGLKMQQKLEKEIADGRLASARSQYEQGALSQTAYLEAQRNAQLEENQRNIEFVQRELEVTKGAGKEQIAARQQYMGELAVLSQQRLNIEQGYNDSVKGIFAARTRQEIDTGNAELTAINDRNQQLADQIRYFNMLPDAITRATIAELENQKAVLTGDFADEAKVNSINAKIEALKRLANTQTAGQQQVFDYDQAQQVAQAWQQTGAKISTALTSAFGKGGAAMGKMMEGYAGFKSQEVALKKQYEDRVKVAAGSEKRIAEAAEDYGKATVQARYGMYADMASAAKGYVGEHTAAYKVLTAVEQAFRIAQMAMAYEEMVRKIFFTKAVTASKVQAIATETTANAASVPANVAADSAKASASGVAAVAKTIASLPFPFNVAAGAAVFAMLVKLGVAMKGGVGGGSVSLSEQRQKEQGTGSVLGDATKKSESIAKAIEHLTGNSDIGLKYSAGMLTALNGIQSSVQGLGSLLVRSTDISNPNVGNLNSNNGLGTTLSTMALGGVFAPLVKSVLPKFVQNWLGSIGTSIFGGKQSLEDSGFTINKGSLSSLLANGVNASTYADVKTSGGWFSSDKHNTQMNSLGTQANAQFSMLLQSMMQGISSAGNALGLDADEFTKKLNSFVVNVGKVSLKGLTGEQIQKQLEAVFSKLGDDMARYALNGLDQFTKVGEGYFETLIRVASGVDAANYALEKLGVTAIKYTDIINKQGDVETEIVRQSLVAQETTRVATATIPTLIQRMFGMFGSKVADYVDVLSGVGEIIQNFTGSAEDMIDAYTKLIKVRDTFNATGLKGGNLTADTVRGAGGLDALSSGAQTFFEKFFTDAEQRTANVKALNAEFTKLGVVMPKDMESFKKLVLTLDDGSAAGDALVGKLLTMSGTFADLFGSSQVVDDARSALSDAYDKEAEAITTVRDRMKDFAKTLRDLHDSSLLGDQSPLTPGQKYDEARRQYEAVLAAARSGDTAAQDKYSGAYNAFLEASKAYNMSGDAYQRDFQYAQQATLEAAQWAEQQVNVQQASLDKLNDMVSGLITVNDSVLSVTQAIERLADALGGGPAGSQRAQIEGLYQSLLGRGSDSGGMDYWMNQLAKGVSVTDIASMIKTSSEYLSTHAAGAYTVPNYVETPTVATPQASSTVSDQAIIERLKALEEATNAQTEALVGALAATSAQNADQVTDALDMTRKATLQQTNSKVSIA